MPETTRSTRYPLRRIALWLITLAVTVAAYWPGLPGDFLFDDNPHIVRNPLVQIDSLSPANLWQAWNSSTFSFPSSRPLAMLTFGVNHAVSGLDPFAFKITNLALHLLNGLVLYAVARRLAALYSRVKGREATGDTARWWAWLTAALWLLHPLNLSPVLLSVQRMTIVATLSVLLGLLCYLIGRRRLVDGTPGGLAWVVASPLFAGVGLLSKESALLLPLLLLVTEWTLLGFGGLNDRSRRNLRLVFLGIAALPVAVATIYLLTNPGLLSYATRPFTMGERVLTEARVLWLYTQMLIAPDISVMGLFHDDVVVSRSLLEPWTTLPAMASLLLAVIGALAVRKRFPLLSFAVLFFLVGHSMESSIIGLELIYEHRNYLPVVAPLFAIAYVPTASRLAGEHGRALVTLAAVTLVLFAAATALRAHQWSGLGRLVTAEVEHHPNSPRANFQYAQVVMTGLDDPELRQEAYALARHHFRRAVDLDPNYVDGLFGLVVLELHVGRGPDTALVDELATRLKRVQFGPLNVSIAQFSYLVEWNLTAEPKLPREQMLAILEAALQNPTNAGMARAAIYNALRAYHHRVLGELEPGLRYAELAVQTDASNWTYHDRLVRLLAEARRFDDARAALGAAMASDPHELHAKDARELGRLIEVARRAGAGTTPTESP